MCGAYRAGEYGHIALCYTNFISVLSQRPGVTSMLPLEDFKKEGAEGPEGVRSLILYEPDSESVFDAIGARVSGRPGLWGYVRVRSQRAGSQKDCHGCRYEERRAR